MCEANWATLSWFGVMEERDSTAKSGMDHLLANLNELTVLLC